MNCHVPFCFRVLLVLLVSFIFAPHAESSELQEKRSDQASSNRFSLGFEDPMMLEYAEVTTEQLEKINAIKQEWQVELDGIRKENGKRQEIRKAYGKSRMRCDAVLDRDQLRKCRRYNLLTSWGPEELVLLSRAIDIGDPEFDEEQVTSFAGIKKSWLQFADERFKVDSSGTYDKAKHEEILAAVSKIKDQYREKIQSDLSELLTESQKTRLKQIELQSLVTSQGVLAFDIAEDASALNLTAAQQAELRQLLDLIEQESVKYLSVSMQFDGYKKIFESLSEEQKNIWREKLGDPFPVNNVRWFQEFMEADEKSTGQNQK